MKKISTFSIVAYSPEENAWGIAVASKFPAVGAVVPWAKAGAGAVATQSYANTTFGPRGLELMQNGKSAQETLDQILAEDDQRDVRQVGMVDTHGLAATYTGENCLSWAGGIVGKHFAVQGNILTGPETVEAMADVFQHKPGDLPDRLYAALIAGDRAGGDRRGKQSAAILVVKPNAGYGGYNDRWLDYRVDDHEEPVPRLGDLIEMHQLYFGKSQEEERLLLSGETLKQLQLIAQERGYYEGSLHGEYDEPTRSALRSFMGNENFEDRVDFEKGEIDEPVLVFLLKKFNR
ncbi:MAG: fimbrial assembly protein FimA [Chloroflexi bacterium RBG_16_48_8]|nr:MAG: fimbrial assembly protein FimA [Chloroflexi bacterium RBG_16_48_8]